MAVKLARSWFSPSHMEEGEKGSIELINLFYNCMCMILCLARGRLWKDWVPQAPHPVKLGVLKFLDGFMSMSENLPTEIPWRPQHRWRWLQQDRPAVIMLPSGILVTRGGASGAGFALSWSLPKDPSKRHLFWRPFQSRNSPSHAKWGCLARHYSLTRWQEVCQCYTTSRMVPGDMDTGIKLDGTPGGVRSGGHFFRTEQPKQPRHLYRCKCSVSSGPSAVEVTEVLGIYADLHASFGGTKVLKPYMRGAPIS